MPSHGLFPKLLPFNFSNAPLVYLYLFAYAGQHRNRSRRKLSTHFEQARMAEAPVMATLQRSAKSFRRQGSSGLVWDDSLLSDQFHEGAKNDKSDLKELRPCQSAKATFAGMDYTSGLDDAMPPATATCPRSLSSSDTNPSQRAYTRSLSGVFGKRYLVKKLKMGKTTDP